MTETSGEKDTWLAGKKEFPTNGAWGIAFKNQQTLTAGRESAIIYWQFAETPDKATASCLTQKNNPTMAPKYVAAKHFYKFIRPDSVAVTCHSDATDGVTASAYVHDKNHTLTVVLVNRSPDPRPATIALPDDFSQAGAFDMYTSSENKLWQKSSTKDKDGKLDLTVPGYGVVTLYGHNQ
jgi:O-glycosyl hydrolase